MITRIMGQEMSSMFDREYTREFTFSEKIVIPIGAKVVMHCENNVLEIDIVENGVSKGDIEIHEFRDEWNIVKGR